MSSSRLVKADIKAGRAYKKKILAVWSSRKKALDHEIELHNRHDVACNSKFLNRAKQTSDGFDRTGVNPWNKGKAGSQQAWNKGKSTPEHQLIARFLKPRVYKCTVATKQKIKDSWTPERRRLHSEKNSGGNNPRAGSVVSARTKQRMTKGWTSEIRKAKSEWTRENSPTRDPSIAAKVSATLKGRPKSTEHRANLVGSKSAAGCAAISKRLTGSIFINNGLINKRLPAGAKCPKGFCLGKLPETRFTHSGFPGVVKMKSHWARWANQNLTAAKVQKFMNQLEKEL